MICYSSKVGFKQFVFQQQIIKTKDDWIRQAQRIDLSFRRLALTTYVPDNGRKLQQISRTFQSCFNLRKQLKSGEDSSRGGFNIHKSTEWHEFRNSISRFGWICGFQLLFGKNCSSCRILGQNQISNNYYLYDLLRNSRAASLKQTNDKSVWGACRIRYDI